VRIVDATRPEPEIAAEVARLIDGVIGAVRR
jgi:hypothetical protein